MVQTFTVTYQAESDEHAERSALMLDHALTWERLLRTLAAQLAQEVRALDGDASPGGPDQTSR